jgi:pimeloyl-ACP methyl ester carboxylesterase
MSEPMAELLVVPAVLTVSIMIFVVTGVVIAVWRFSGVPLNQYRDTHCPDGVGIDSDVTPSWLGLHWREVQIPTPLGDSPAWLVPAEHSETWAIMIHGRGGTRASWIETLSLLHQAKVTSLSVSLRNDVGAPPSGDCLDHLGTTEWEDIEAAVMYARRSGARHVILFARSAGAMVAMQFLRHSSCAHLVTDMVLDDPVLDWRAVFLNCRPGWLPKWVANLILAVSSARIQVRLDKLDVAKWPPVNRPRTLIIHGEGDQVVPFECSQRFVDELGSQWPLVLVPTVGDHGATRANDPEWHDLLIRTWLGHEPLEVTT